MNSEGNKLYVLRKGAVSQLSSLVHFLITTNHTSLFATKIDKLLENDKSQPRTCQTNMSPKHLFQRRKQQNDEWTLKNCQANMFSKKQNCRFRFCLLQVRPSLSPVVFGVLFIRSFHSIWWHQVPNVWILIPFGIIIRFRETAHLPLP